VNGWLATEGSPSPLGVTWIEEEQAFDFALYSKHASQVTLLLYADSDLVHSYHSYRFDPLVNKSGRVWHCRLKAAAIPKAKYYGYAVGGRPKSREGNNRFRVSVTRWDRDLPSS
jgi:glycogen operon protein